MSGNGEGGQFRVEDPPDGGSAEKIAFGPQGFTVDGAEIASLAAVPLPEWTVTGTLPRRRWRRFGWRS